MNKPVKRPVFRIREDKSEKLEVHVAGFCFRKVGTKLQLLVGRRQPTRELFPGCWECGGGQMNAGENFEEALKRQYFEEFGIEVRVLRPLMTYEIIRARGPKIPGIKFLCVSADNGKEEVELNKRELSEFQWISESRCSSLRMIPGVQKQAKDAFGVAKLYWNVQPKPSQKRTIGFGAQG